MSANNLLEFQAWMVYQSVAAECSNCFCKYTIFIRFDNYSRHFFLVFYTHLVVYRLVSITEVAFLSLSVNRTLQTANPQPTPWLAIARAERWNYSGHKQNCQIINIGIAYQSTANL